MVSISAIYQAIDAYETPIAGEFPLINGIGGYVELVFDGYKLIVEPSKDDSNKIVIRAQKARGSKLSAAERYLTAKYAAIELIKRYPDLLKDAVIDINKPRGGRLIH